jgi:hypothetical protein
MEWGEARKLWRFDCFNNYVGQYKIKNCGETTMAMEKKSLVSKKATTPTKGKTTKSKVDTSKPATSKVVAARSGPGYPPFKT